MAENQRESNILATGSIDIDVSDALKGLKALRREANETIKVLDKLNECLNKLPKDNSGQAVFDSTGDGLSIKCGSLEIQHSEVSADGEWTLRKGDIKQIGTYKVKHQAKWLTVELNVLSANAPYLLLEIDGEKQMKSVERGRCTFYLGKPITKELNLKLYAYTSDFYGYSKFKMKRIYQE